MFTTARLKKSGGAGRSPNGSPSRQTEKDEHQGATSVLNLPCLTFTSFMLFVASM